MSGSFPESQLIIGYREFYRSDPPENRLDILGEMSKDTVIGEIAALNYRLKPKRTIYLDTSLETQCNILKHFFLYNPSLYNAYYYRYSKFIKDDNHYGLLISRRTCLFALEELIQSDLPLIKDFNMAESWEKLFQYLLAVNTEITKYETETVKEEKSGDPLIDFPLEKVNAKLIALNEMSLTTDPIYTPYRGYYFCKYIIDKTELGEYLEKYFVDSYGMVWDNFIFEILGLYIANNPHGENDIQNPITEEKLDTSFYFTVQERDKFLFEAFSKVYPNPNPHTLISVKKYPFYKHSEDTYTLLDNQLLIDKAYNQLINDLWFDIIKPVKDNTGKNKYNISAYRSVIGLFFEEYLRMLFQQLFGDVRYGILKLFDELLLRRGKEQNELADVYFRFNKKIFIAQAKTTGIYNNEKYSGELDVLYKKSRNAFFDSFGVGQLVKSIENLEDMITRIDFKFPAKKAYRVYPAIIVNENAMQTPLMAEIFKVRFSELTAHLISTKVTIFPLTLVHVSDLENMIDNIQGDPSAFFGLLDKAKSYRKFTPPFYKVLDWEGIYPLHKETMKVFRTLFAKYGTGEGHPNEELTAE